MLALEGVLRERLSIPNAVIFQRSIARRTIQYQVVDNGNELASTMATQFVQQLELPSQKKGVVYVRSYATGDTMSEALGCPFYKATADDKAKVLEEWKRAGGWIVATGTLGTGINIEGIIYVVHVDRPYGLTSFLQQSGRGGRDGEISESTIIVRVQNSRDWRGQRPRGVLSAYSVEEVDEEAMTAFILAKTCRRQVLSQYMDQEGSGSRGSGEGKVVDCISTDSVFCDRCKTTNGPRPQEPGTKRQAPSGRYFIDQQLRAQQDSYDAIVKVMDDLQGQCIYCALWGSGSEGPFHKYSDCREAEANGFGCVAYTQWQKRIDFGRAKHCWECGLCQSMCRRLEQPKGERLPCEYMDIMLPSMFVLQRNQHLQKIVEMIGF